MVAHWRQTFIMLFWFSMIVGLNICSAQVTKLWVVYDMQRETFEIKNTAQSDCIAVATYENSINQIGSLMSMHWINTVEGICPEPLDRHCQSLKNYLQSNMDWMQQQVKQYSTQESPYWYHVGFKYFPDTSNKNGGPAMVAKYGDYLTYEKTSRALIFKWEVPKIKDIDSMIKLMRYNNFKEDALSRCNCTPPYSAENAIACCDDLNVANGTYPFSMLGHRPHVATDMKLTNNEMFGSLLFLAVSSPTYVDLPPFQWSKLDYDKVLSHLGHPDLWNFPVITFNGSVPVA